MTPAISLPPTPSKSPDAISGMFNRIAQRYDLLNTCMTGGMHHWWKAQACNALGLKAGDSVLDVCTGTGDLAGILAKRVGETGTVTGVDFSTEMLAVAQKRFAQQHHIRFEQGDALALPFADNTFDAAIISFGLRNVASIETALAEMYRVLKPGGRMLNLDTASDCNNPLFWLYFKGVMPWLGKVLAQDEAAYRYLCQSTQTFATSVQLAQQFTQLGLHHVTIRKLGLGSVAWQMGQKSPH